MWARSSSVPARWIENAYLTEPSSNIGKVWKEIKIRAEFVFFMVTVGFDFMAAIASYSAHNVGVLVRTGDAQDAHLKELKKYGTIFSKNALAMFSVIPGIVQPKLVELHFNVENPAKGIVAGGSYYRAPDVKIEYPENTETVMRLIKNGAENNQKIMPIGAGRSQGKQFIPEGLNGEETLALNLSQMNGVVINPEEKTATIGAGARWSDVQNEANKFGLALQVMQASNVFSAGGSVGTNIHGWNHQVGVLSNTILSIDLVNAAGEKETWVRPQAEDKNSLFHYVTGGLGLFGTVTGIKIKLTDNELLKEIGTDVKPANYINHFRHKVQKDENIRMHLYRLSLDPNDLLGTGVAVDYVRVGDVSSVKTPNLKQEDTYGSRTDQILVNIGRRMGFSRERYWKRERARLLANDSKPLTTNEVMQPPINAMFHDAASEAEWLQEYFLPEDNLSEFLGSLGRLLMKNNVALINASVRFVKQHNQSPLSYARDGDRFAVVLCFNQLLQHSQVVKATKWLREAQRLALDLGGAYYLPYQHVSHPEDFKRAYPGAAEAMRKKLEVDPNEIFSSGLYQKYLAPIAHEQKPKPNYYRELTKSQKMKERFTGFLTVVLQRIEAKELFVLLEDILTYKDSPSEIYEELCQRLTEITPSVLADFRHVLQSLSNIKNDLTEQAAVLLNDTKKINGLVEVGYPGRFIDGFKKNFEVTGTITAVYEAPSVTDYVQTGFPRPYHKYAKLDYNDPDLHTIPDNSADVITCYVGLHHFPEDKVRGFLKEIRRVLRPGGHFLLVDHDVRNEEEMAMAHGAHIIFNAVTGVSLKEEERERRHFAPMTYWARLLQEAGLGYDVSGADVDMIRAGDPSRNRMVSFAKPMMGLEKTRSEEFKAAAPVAASSWISKKTQLSVTLSSATLFATTADVTTMEPVSKQEVKQERSPKNR